MKQRDRFYNLIAKLEEARVATPRLLEYLKKIERDYDDILLAREGATSNDDTGTFIRALSILQTSGVLYKVFLNNLNTALLSSEEYNYNQYKDILLTVASEENFNKSIQFKFGMGTFRISLDTDILFAGATPEKYIHAVNQVRRNIKDSDMLARSKRWKENIYKPGREGKRIFYGQAKRKNKKASVKMYGSIVRRRTDLGKAGFWYFLDKGNYVNAITMSKGGMGLEKQFSLSSGGIPYPRQVPTNFITKTELGIYRIISKQVLDMRIPIASQKVPGISKDTRYQAAKLAIKEATDVMQRAFRAMRKDGLLPVGKTFGRIHLLEGSIEIIKRQTGKIGEKYRRPGE